MSFKDVVLSKLKEQEKFYSSHNPSLVPGLFHARYIISSMVNLDEQIKHGKWIREEEFEGIFDVPYLCSECGGQVIVSGIMTPKGHGYEYCPMCGAKMDLEVIEND